MNYVLLSGYLKSSGLFFVELLDKFQATATHTSLLFAIRHGVYSVGGKTSNSVIIIAFKGAIRDFFTISSLRANRLQHVRSIGPGAVASNSRATLRALIACNMCYVPCGTKGQLSY